MKYAISFATFSHIALFGSWTTCFVSATCEKVDHMQMLMFLSGGYSSMVSFILSTTFSVTEIPPRRDSPNCQLLPLYSQFWFTKILKALQVLTFTAFWRNVPRQTNVTKTSSRRHFRACFLKYISISMFFHYWLQVDI